MEIDIFIPSVRIGIEYDGAAFHNSQISYENEKLKYSICREKKVILFRIREFVRNNENEICDFCLHIPHRHTDNDLSKIIQELLQKIGNKRECIDVEKDKQQIQSSYLSVLKESSIAIARPDLAREWHPYRNGTLTPDMFSKSSGDKVWWKCSNDHEWCATISSRYKGNNCPYCSGKKILSGYNDFATKNPKLIKEWDYNKNIIKPNTIAESYKERIWWKCSKCGYEWQAKIISRIRGAKCPYCKSISHRQI